ncbi:chaperone NapD [Marinobacter bryozoorum]|jgi:nitrate reductase NapD|uniref:chaperone NapD n=1 Tax=Marinobacter bryozoorum TaxID=256324 RepID=UPI00200532B9|nr:chaperone NapD [Marinobacter bryozoorum]MCK7544104.1 chaperone NapD [Marinobacter bryozoorum]
MTDVGPPEVHIASFIVHYQPDQDEALELALNGIEQVEPQPADPAGPGKRIVICEGPHQGYILDQMEVIESLPGVYGCSMVYHEVMNTREADQQMITEVKSA